MSTVAKRPGMPKGGNLGNKSGRATAGIPKGASLTKALGKRICDRLSQGLPFGLACQAEGVSSNTADEWVRRGEGRDERPGTPLMEWFAAEKKKARARWAQSRIQEIVKDESWQSSAWALERTMPEHFGRPADRIEVTGQGGGAVRVEIAFDTSGLVEAVNARRALNAASVIDVEAEEIA